MPIPWTDTDMLEALTVFLQEAELEDFSDDDALSAEYDEWRDEAEGIDDPPTAAAICARFGDMFNALAFTGELTMQPSAEDRQMEEFIGGALAEHSDLSDASRLAITANGLAHFIWRNGPIEFIHGGGGLEALSDGDMMRTNALVSHLVASELNGPASLTEDLLRIRRSLLDPRREWPTGETLWGMCEGFIGELVKSVNDAIAGVQGLASRTSAQYVYDFSLLRGLTAEPSGWAGSPWWPYTVSAFIRQAQERQPWEEVPLAKRWSLTVSMKELEDLLLQPLYLLDKETADWTASAFSFCAVQGKEDWRAAGSPQL